jgi:hypothetical protein
MTLTNKLKYEIIDIFGRLVAAFPPFLTTLHFFPLWVKESPGATVSGVAVLAFIVCMIPMWRKLLDFKKYIFSASMPVFWIVVGAVFYFLHHIASSMVYISLAGLAGSLMCIPITMWRNKYKPTTPTTPNVSIGQKEG